MLTEQTENFHHILVVDDDPDIRELLADYLQQHGYRVSRAADGAAMFAELERLATAREAVDLVVLDIMMPGEDGLSLCRRLRATSRLPVIFLTALGELPDRVAGLELGADDYLVKPFQPRELLARIRAVLRRASGPGPEEETGEENGQTRQAGAETQCYIFQGWTLDVKARHLCDEHGLIVNLSGAEFRLLRFFLEHPQEVLSRDQLQEVAQGQEAGKVDRSPFDRSIDVQVCRLRARLRDSERESRLIKTVRGDGYVLTAQVSRSDREIKE